MHKDTGTSSDKRFAILAASLRETFASGADPPAKLKRIAMKYVHRRPHQDDELRSLGRILLCEKKR